MYWRQCGVPSWDAGFSVLLKVYIAESTLLGSEHFDGLLNQHDVLTRNSKKSHLCSVRKMLRKYSPQRLATFNSSFTPSRQCCPVILFWGEMHFGLSTCPKLYSVLQNCFVGGFFMFSTSSSQTHQYSAFKTKQVFELGSICQTSHCIQFLPLGIHYLSFNQTSCTISCA